MVAEADISLMHQLFDPVHRETSGLLLEPLQHCSLDGFICPKSMAIELFLV